MRLVCDCDSPTLIGDGVVYIADSRPASAYVLLSYPSLLHGIILWSTESEAMTEEKDKVFYDCYQFY